MPTPSSPERRRAKPKRTRNDPKCGFRIDLATRNEPEIQLDLHLATRNAPETTPTCGLANTLRIATRPKRTRNAVWPTPCEPKGARNDPDTWLGLDLATHSAAGRSPKYGLAYTLRPETHPKRTRCVVWPTPCDPKRTRSAVWLRPSSPEHRRTNPKRTQNLVFAQTLRPETNPKSDLAYTLRPERHPETTPTCGLAYTLRLATRPKQTRNAVWLTPCEPKGTRNDPDMWFGLDLATHNAAGKNPKCGQRTVGGWICGPLGGLRGGVRQGRPPPRTLLILRLISRGNNGSKQEHGALLHGRIIIVIVIQINQW